MKQLKKHVFSTPTVTLCYARDGRRLYDGPVDKIPEYYANWYTDYWRINKVIQNTYMEICEDSLWWRKER